MKIYSVKARDEHEFLCEHLIGAKTAKRAIELMCEYCHDTFTNDSWRITFLEEVKDTNYNGIIEKIIY